AAGEAAHDRPARRSGRHDERRSRTHSGRGGWHRALAPARGTQGTARRARADQGGPVTQHDRHDDPAIETLLRTHAPAPPIDDVDWNALHARITRGATPLL